MVKNETAIVNKFVGSRGWLWFWLIMCLPIGVAYYFVRREPVRVTVKTL